MKYTFPVLRFGYTDSLGDIFLPDSLMYDLEKGVPVLIEFDQKRKVGSVLSLFENNGVLFAEVYSRESLTGLYPAIGFLSNKNERIGALRVVENATLFAIGVSKTVNIDPEIPPIQ